MKQWLLACAIFLILISTLLVAAQSPVPQLSIQDLRDMIVERDLTIRRYEKYIEQLENTLKQRDDELKSLKGSPKP